MSTHSPVQYVPPQDSESSQCRVTWVPNSCSVATGHRRGHAFGRLALAVFFLVASAATLWWLIR